MGEDMSICNLGILRGTFVSGSIFWEPQMSLPCCSLLNKNMHHFSFFQVSFLLISEAFTNLIASHQNKILMEFRLGERGVGREVDSFREENYSLLSSVTALHFPPGKKYIALEENNIK